MDACAARGTRRFTTAVRARWCGVLRACLGRWRGMRRPAEAAHRGAASTLATPIASAQERLGLHRLQPGSLHLVRDDSGVRTPRPTRRSSRFQHLPVLLIVPDRTAMRTADPSKPRTGQTCCCDVSDIRASTRTRLVSADCAHVARDRWTAGRDETITIRATGASRRPSSCKRAAAPATPAESLLPTARSSHAAMSSTPPRAVATGQPGSRAHDAPE